MLYIHAVLGNVASAADAARAYVVNTQVTGTEIICHFHIEPFL